MVSEKIIWAKLKGRQLGYKFRRQQGIDRYIVDFYCSELKLVIDIDGANHESYEEVQSDRRRQNYLESLGIKVKRYLNVDVKNNLEEVVCNILNICKSLDKKKSLHPQAPPHPRRGVKNS